MAVSAGLGILYVASFEVDAIMLIVKNPYCYIDLLWNPLKMICNVSGGFQFPHRAEWVVLAVFRLP